MKVHRDIDHLPAFKNAVITIGTFDGVHKGHLQIINQLKGEAKQNKGESVIITFHPHPRMVIENSDNKSAIRLLNTLDEKIELLEKQGIDHVVIVPFTHEFSEQTAEEYIKNFLVEKFHPHTIIIGYDHHFGKGRKGNYLLLEALQKEYNYTVKEIPQYVLHHISISSTKIRNALLKGNIEEANEFLGYEYFIEGVVIEGDKRGRTIGFPTANIHLTDANKLVPVNGVYIAEVQITGKNGLLKGMMNIGTRPTVDGTKTVIEVHILDFNETIYEKRLRIFFKKFLRNEVKFSSIDELKDQLTKDKGSTVKYFSDQKY
jgi:riboflavin kinase / FMN adenylyltransferase